MPPRYAYWTILIDNKTTAFRARDREELVPTLPPPPAPAQEDAREQRTSGVQLIPGAGDPEPQSAATIGAVALRTITISGPVAPRAEEPGSTSPATRPEPPRPSSRPPILRPKPDLASRPLVGYSLGGDEVAEERIDTGRITSRPPER